MILPKGFIAPLRIYSDRSNGVVVQSTLISVEQKNVYSIRNIIYRDNIIISPKFEISGMLWFWSGRRRRRRRRIRRRRRRRRTPRLVFHVIATQMRVSNSYLT